MEIKLDQLISRINASKKAVISFYLFGEIGFEVPRFTKENPHMAKNDEGDVFFQIGEEDEEAGYYINDSHEIYQEETDEAAEAKFEVRDQGILLMEIWVY